MKIEEIDPNFKVKDIFGREDITFYDVNQEPMEVRGVFVEDGKFRRMPQAVAESANGGVGWLNPNTAGGRVRFRTDSPFIAVSMKSDCVGKMPHFALTGSAGFDMYETTEDGQENYIGSFQPPFEIEDGFSSLVELEFPRMRDITLNMPLYSSVTSLRIGVKEGSSVEKVKSRYVNDKPVVYYGSSITQGGCASRPGNCYQAILSRRFNIDYVNLGFSGAALAEDTVVEYMAGLPCSLFVLDYDHNAPSAEHLEATHEKAYQRIRAAQPDLPIVMMSRPKHILTPDEQHRLAIITRTYERALAAGDKNVYLLDGPALTALCGNDGTVDNCHPNDFGFASMAKALGDLIEKIGIFSK